MEAKRLRQLLKARPFKPFVLHVSELASYQVPHPDWAMLNPQGETMVVMDDDGGFMWMDTKHVTRVTNVPSKSSSARK